MFELTDSALERVIFAMEDHAGGYLIRLDSGDVVPKPASPASGEAPPGTCFPPSWSSRDGFEVMERFHAALRNPSLRAELGAALGRGKGVFKAFKEILAAYPEAERAFRDFKTRAMRQRIESWLDDLREAEGLERLYSPPDEVPDLAEANFRVEVSALTDMPPGLPALIAEAAEAAKGTMPAPSVESELQDLNSLFSAGTGGLCAHIADDEGGLIAAAIGLRLSASGRGHGLIRFLFVRQGFRRMGLGRSVLDSLRAALHAEGIGSTVLDSLFLPQDYGATLEALGYRPLGVRALAPPPD